MDGGIVRLVGQQDRWQSNLVDNFERALDAKLRRAEAKLLATLAQRLTLDSGRLARTSGNVAAMRWLGPAFERQLSKEGYGTLVTAFVGQFPGQFRFFDETLQLLKLPRIDWAAADRRAFLNQQIVTQDALASVVKTVGENAKRRALLSIGGLKIDQLAELLGDEFGKTLPQAVGLADTAMSVFYATVADAGYRRYEDAGVEVRFKYYGPADKITRPFCKKLLTTGKAYTREQVGQMDNGQLPNVMVSRGGYRCRHQWILAVEAIDMIPPPDGRPDSREKVLPPKPDHPKPGAKGDKRTGEDVRNDLAARLRELGDMPLIGKREALRKLIYAERAGKADLLSSTSKAVPKNWRAGMEEFNRVVGDGKVDGKFAGFEFTRKKREHFSASKMSVMLRRNTPIDVVVHELGHWLEERIPEIHRKAVEFLRRRTAGESAQSLRILTKNSGYGRHEIAKPDRFSHPYIGKIYSDFRYTEIVSMGLQEMWEKPDLLMQDADYFDFLWDLIRR